MTPGEIATVITAVLGSGGVSAFGTYRLLGLGNGKGWRQQVLARLDTIAGNTALTSERIDALTRVVDQHEQSSALARRDVALLLDRSTRRRTEDRP